MIKPDALKRNDKVAIVATAKSFEPEQLEAGKSILESIGLKVITGPNVLKKHNQFAGTDEERLADIQDMINNKEIKAIFCARGGYGTSRFIDQVNLKALKKYPKWIIGFSDVTVLLSHLQKAGICCIHGPMPITLARDNNKLAIDSLKKVLFGKSIFYKISPHILNRKGTAEGIVTGGNLAILCSIIGTSSDIPTKGKILFLEDIGENLYRLDRMMVHMKRAGKLKDLVGMIVGQLSDMEDNQVPFGKTAEEIIADAVKEYDFPVCFGFSGGHEAENLSLIFGENAEIKISARQATVRYL